MHETGTVVNCCRYTPDSALCNSIKKSEISWKFLIVYLFSIVFIISSFVFMNVGQAFLIRELDPSSDVASSAMTLVFYDELLAIVLIGIWGYFSDQIGRKYIYATGFALIAISMLSCASFANSVFPYNIATIFTSLLTFRLLFSVGCSMVASLMTAFLSDIAHPASTGRLAGLVGIASCVGGLVGAVVFPMFLSRTGFLALAGCLFITSVSILACFKDIVAPGSLQCYKKLELNKLIAISFNSAKKDQNILLSYLNASVSRSVTMINTSLLEPWIASALTLTQPNDIRPTVIRLNGILQGTSLIMAPIFGIICSRISPAVATFFAAAFCILGDFTMVKLVTSPLSRLQMFVMFLKGAGQIGLIVSGMSLASRHAPSEIRGTISGAYGFFGAFGIILNSQLARFVGTFSPLNPFILLLVWDAITLLFAFTTITLSSRKTVLGPNRCNIEI